MRQPSGQSLLTVEGERLPLVAIQGDGVGLASEQGVEIRVDPFPVLGTAEGGGSGAALAAGVSVRVPTSRPPRTVVIAITRTMVCMGSLQNVHVVTRARIRVDEADAIIVDEGIGGSKTTIPRGDVVPPGWLSGVAVLSLNYGCVERCSSRNLKGMNARNSALLGFRFSGAPQLELEAMTSSLLSSSPFALWRKWRM